MSNIKIYFDDRILELTGDSEEPTPLTHQQSFYNPSPQLLQEIIGNLESGSYNHVLLSGRQTLFSEICAHFRRITAGGGIIFNSRDELLIMFRRGKWDLPKGKQDEGESDMECALRECTEETGLKNLSVIRSFGSTFHTYSGKRSAIFKETIWFLMKWAGGEPLIPQTEEDITELKWVSVFDQPDYMDQTSGSIREILQKIYESV
ncbi:MAG TPA: NUDIX domain-containing protein [Ginsengibacter sp.]|nr:NUDIX domain-containing protein [Ginsengibacter sp.]